MQLPNSLPDETLFSRFIRHMSLLGLSETEYLQRLLKEPRASIHPYLTIGIKQASQISGDSVSKIYNEQTLARFFAYFLPQHSQAIYDSLLANDSSKALRASQLVTFKESEVLSLKFCPTCCTQDIINFGVAYWHLIHQVPGVEACPIHEVWLIHEDLPKRPHLKPLFLPSYSKEAVNCTQLSYQFAKFTKKFLTAIAAKEEFFSNTTLLLLLKKQGYLRDTGRFKRKELTSDFFRFTKALERTPTKLLPSSNTDYRYLSYLLSGNVGQHPFKYLLILFWLNNNRFVLSEAQPKAINNNHSSPDKKSLDVCLSMLKAGNTLAKISSITGKSRCYLKSLAIRNNITARLKPNIINERMRTSVLVMAYKGFHRKAIAKQFGISTGSVEQIISTECGLVKRRKRYKYESNRRRHKHSIRRELEKNPSAIRQDIKSLCYAAFYWLYRHERDWLNSTLPKATKPQSHPKVNWHRRDIELKERLKPILTISETPISLTKLDKVVGNHGWLTRYRHKLPMTMNLIRQFNTRISQP